MKATIGFSFLFFGFVFSSASQVKLFDGITFPRTYFIVRPVHKPASDTTGWKLIFEDEFNGERPDDAKWLASPPWGTVLFFGDATRHDSSMNGSVECYLPGNLVVDKGTLKLVTKNEEVISHSSYDKPDSALQPDGLPSTRLFHYTSGCLYSKQSFGPGKFEIRCKIPKVDGVWPAFWLFGGCAQEFDVFEFVNGKFSDNSEECSRRLQMTYHRYADCNDPGTWCSHGTAVLDTIDYSKDFHIYSVEWDEYQVTWRVDGQVKKVTYGLKRMHLNSPVDERNIKPGKKYRLFKVMPIKGTKVNIIVSCAVTNYGNAKQPLTRGSYPATFEVDYIRVWTRE
ncbi:MAG TPA: glycoside hydrolase family 16 protein [Bacteroidia bacterium]